jgi:succinyl-diaminopimelate desuccinylase
MGDIERMIADARSYVDEVWEDVVADIDYLVRVESVDDTEHAATHMPFGPGPREALSRALEIAGRLGLSTTDCDGHIGFGDVVGKSDDYIATIAHADIVPVGTGWDFDPLALTRKDGLLVGRGVLDDKGPLVLSLYAAHFFVRQCERTGKRLPHTLRCIVGINEETGMRDVAYYLERYPQPLFCFTPDSAFPLICGEKGRFAGYVATPYLSAEETSLRLLEGGTVPNAVPGEACALVSTRAVPNPDEGVEATVEGESEHGELLVRLRAHGVGGHAATPEGTRNAIGMLATYLARNGLCDGAERPFLEFEQMLLDDAYGCGLGIATADGPFGALTCVGGTVRTIYRDGLVRFVQSFDIRYPSTITGEVLERLISRIASEHGLELTDTEDLRLFYLSPDSSQVRALVDTYNRVFKRQEEPITIGGGTYARHFERAVAFGPDDQSCSLPDWAGQEHGPNEAVAEETLKRALVTYIVSIARLNQAEGEA